MVRHSSRAKRHCLKSVEMSFEEVFVYTSLGMALYDVPTNYMDIHYMFMNHFKFSNVCYGCASEYGNTPLHKTKDAGFTFLFIYCAAVNIMLPRFSFICSLLLFFLQDLFKTSLIFFIDTKAINTFQDVIWV